MRFLMITVVLAAVLGVGVVVAFDPSSCGACPSDFTLYGSIGTDIALGGNAYACPWICRCAKTSSDGTRDCFSCSNGNDTNIEVIALLKGKDGNLVSSYLDTAQTAMSGWINGRMAEVLQAVNSCTTEERLEENLGEESKFLGSLQFGRRRAPLLNGATPAPTIDCYLYNPDYDFGETKVNEWHANNLGTADVWGTYKSTLEAELNNDPGFIEGEGCHVTMPQNHAYPDDWRNHVACCDNTGGGYTKIGGNCYTQKTYDEAVALCSAQGYRLCSKDEIHQTYGDTGCDAGAVLEGQKFKYQPKWTSSTMVPIVHDITWSVEVKDNKYLKVKRSGVGPLSQNPARPGMPGDLYYFAYLSKYEGTITSSSGDLVFTKVASLSHTAPSASCDSSTTTWVAAQVNPLLEAGEPVMKKALNKVRFQVLKDMTTSSRK